MKIYKCSKDLEGKVLNNGDIVIFEQFNLCYKVHVRFLCADGVSNDTIFKEIGKNSAEFCKRYYGYPSSGGGWPECKDGDYAALTRVVMALFKEIENSAVESEVKLETTTLVDSERKKEEFYFTNINPIQVKF